MKESTDAKEELLIDSLSLPPKEPPNETDGEFKLSVRDFFAEVDFTSASLSVRSREWG